MELKENWKVYSSLFKMKINTLKYIREAQRSNNTKEPINTDSFKIGSPLTSGT